MRKYLRSESKELIENNTRFSKVNYRSRRNFSIETVISEKRLIFNNSILLKTTCKKNEINTHIFD